MNFSLHPGCFFTIISIIVLAILNRPRALRSSILTVRAITSSLNCTPLSPLYTIIYYSEKKSVAFSYYCSAIFFHSSLGGVLIQRRDEFKDEHKPQVWSGRAPCYDKDGNVKVVSLKRI